MVESLSSHGIDDENGGELEMHALNLPLNYRAIRGATEPASSPESHAPFCGTGELPRSLAPGGLRDKFLAVECK